MCGGKSDRAIPIITLPSPANTPRPFPPPIPSVPTSSAVKGHAQESITNAGCVGRYNLTGLDLREKGERDL